MITLDDILLKIPDYHNGNIVLTVNKRDVIETITFYKDKNNNIRVIRKFKLYNQLFKTNESIKNRNLVDYLNFMFKTTWKIDINVITRPIHAGVNPVYINPDGSQKTGLSWTKSFNKLNSLLCK